MPCFVEAHPVMRYIASVLVVFHSPRCLRLQHRTRQREGACRRRSSGGKHAVIETDTGSIEIEFVADQQPKAVENFRLLAEHGYYGLTFHRVVKGFMVQGADPLGDGTGGESAWGAPFADDIDPDSPLYRAGYRRGVVAMANSGPNTNGSQFFIMHDDYPLPPRYVISARVTSASTSSMRSPMCRPRSAPMAPRAGRSPR